jgi:hypothetical protein
MDVELPDDEQQARLLTNRLLESVEAGKHQGASERLPIYVADVETAVSRFSLQLRFWQELGSGFPCFRPKGEEPLLIDMLGGFAPASESQLSPFPEKYWVAILQMGTELWRRWAAFVRPSPSRGLPLSECSTEEARESFASRLAAFLTLRYRAKVQVMSFSPGLQFKVVTTNPGLRVHYSPAYFFNPWNVFGGPTTPVYGWIQPGRYIFGAVGPDFPMQFESGHFDMPPSTEARLVCA